MTEYDSIASLTKKFLQGKLYKLTMEFVNPQNLRVAVVYEDDYKDQVEYDLEIHPESNDTLFLGHQFHKVLYKVNLERNSKFEDAVCGYLCSTFGK